MLYDDMKCYLSTFQTQVYMFQTIDTQLHVRINCGAVVVFWMSLL
jgi:hypothetical protein